MGATARTIARPGPWPSSVPRAQRSGDSDKVRGEAACAPQFDRQTAGAHTRLELCREVAHARHDGALDLMRGKGHAEARPHRQARHARHDHGVSGQRGAGVELLALLFTQIFLLIRGPIAQRQTSAKGLQF